MRCILIKKFFLFLFIILILFITVPLSESHRALELQKQLKTKIMTWTGQNTDQQQPLKVPDKHAFAIQNIELYMDKGKVEALLGKPKRVTANEYGTQWYTYHHRYQQFVMVSYVNNKVHALYTNQNGISSQSKLKYGSPKAVVRERLGTPEKELKKRQFRLQLKQDEYDVFKQAGTYTTAFYDKHSDNNLTALLIVSEQLEDRLQNQYAPPSDALKKGFELQNFDLVNAERVAHNLSILEYSAGISETARKHSVDMSKHHYFDHVNLQGESPFDRLDKDDWKYRAAAENLAYGQVSAIYAHEGLMNSLGHRKNILNRQVTTLGVGVAFNEERQPYWTENYIG